MQSGEMSREMRPETGLSAFTPCDSFLNAHCQKSAAIRTKQRARSPRRFGCFELMCVATGTLCRQTDSTFGKKKTAQEISEGQQAPAER
jgi:hypothetical protein